MKRISERILAFLMVVVVALTSCATNSIKVVEMSGSDLLKRNEGRNKDAILIIDARPFEQYVAGHIPHAINILSDNIEAEIKTGRLDAWKEMPVITYCNTGPRAQVVADALSKAGFKKVFLAAGVKQHNYELVTYVDILGDTLEKMAKESDVVVVDYRPTEVFTQGHLEGAINIPLNELDANLNLLPKDKKIVFYCNTGTQSAKAAKALKAKGYSQVFNSIIGIKEYNFKLVK